MPSTPNTHHFKATWPRQACIQSCLCLHCHEGNTPVSAYSRTTSHLLQPVKHRVMYRGDERDRPSTASGVCKPMSPNSMVTTYSRYCWLCQKLISVHAHYRCWNKSLGWNWKLNQGSFTSSVDHVKPVELASVSHNYIQTELKVKTVRYMPVNMSMQSHIISILLPIISYLWQKDLHCAKIFYANKSEVLSSLYIFNQ